MAVPTRAARRGMVRANAAARGGAGGECRPNQRCAAGVRCPGGGQNNGSGKRWEGAVCVVGWYVCVGTKGHCVCATRQVT